MRGLLITGTDTNVGKTHVACAIIRDLRSSGYRVGAYKPVCSGARAGDDGQTMWDDVEALRAALGRDISVDQISPQRFTTPVAPPIAARHEGKSVDRAALLQGVSRWQTDCDILIVEGAGGLLCPLTDDTTIADFAVDLGFPVLFVARTGLGTINHTLLTIEAARHRGLIVAGVVLNEATSTDSDSMVKSNADEIVLRSGASVLAIRRHNATNWVGRNGEPTQLDCWPLAKESQSACGNSGC